MATTPPHRSLGDDAGLDPLAVLGTLAERLSPEDLGRTLDAAADLLCAAAGADDCEIALREPDGGDLVLASCSGADREALMERLRFQHGEGFPGIAAATRIPCETRCLGRDPRFLRRTVPQRGISAFASIPLQSAGQLLGCVSLAWRDDRAPIAEAIELVTRACRPLASAVRAGLLAARETVDRALESAGTDEEMRARACLKALAEAAGARSGALALYDAAGRNIAAFTTGASADMCADVLDGRTPCPPLQLGHGVVLHGGRATWPCACRQLPASVQGPVCLPLRSEQRLRGVMVLDRPAPSSPPTRDVVLLLTMAGEAAARIKSAHGDRPARRVRAGADRHVLEVRCFGGFEVRRDGGLIPPDAFARRKARMLLRVLILRAGLPVHRDVLVEHLWPGVDGRTGANRLHGVVHALRAAIEPYHDESRWIFVSNTADLYRFNLESPHWIDLYEFQRQVVSAQDAERHGRRNEAIRHLEFALGLYQGDLFADEPYAGWCELDRCELRQRAVDLMAHVALLCVAAGESERGVAWLRRAIRADPLREDLHRILIRELLALGLRGDARAQYDLCVRVLRDELGVDPSPATRRLTERLLAD